MRGALEPVATDQPEELGAKLDALTTLLLDEGLREIFDEIESTPKPRKLPNNDYRNIEWRQAASTKLRNEHRLIENWDTWDYCYQLTSRGEVIHEALTRIDEASIFEDLDSHEQTKRWVRLVGTGRGLP